MSQQFNTTELDFQQIKNNLISYFKRQGGQFKDYDFTGSGMDQLMDILAYNTHYNAVNSHMAMNESFLDSAQVRGNVVSRAKLLGYTPKSVTAPSASINVTFSRSPANSSNSLTLPAGTQFITNIDDTTYVFETVESVTQQIDNTTGSTFTFRNLVIKQGSSKVENYSIDNSYDQRFVINSSKVDTSSLKVEVYPTLDASGTPEIFELFSEFPNVDGTSLIYFIDENADGNYEIRFGNNLFGKRPQASGLVRLTYLVSDGSITNGARVFTYKAGQISGVESNVSIQLVNSAAGGSAAEGIDSIKYNAPLSFIAQERAVTSDDYKSLIMKKFTGIDNVVAWGGETEVPAKFGRIYISIKPTATSFLTSLQKQEILAYLDKKKVVGITPEIVDPEYTYIYFEIFFKYDPSATASSAGGLAANIKQSLINYNTTKLNNFEGVYRHSNLVSSIDSVNRAILNTTARVYCYKNVRVTASNADAHTADFGFTLDGTIDQKQSMISTSAIQIGGENIFLADEPLAGDNIRRRIYSFKIDATGNQARVNNNIGFLTPSTGLVDLSGLQNDVDQDVQINVRPASDDIISNKKKILQIDIDRTNILGDIDNMSIAGSAGLSKYNTFTRDA
jgi:hypothetical protein